MSITLNAKEVGKIFLLKVQKFRIQQKYTNLRVLYGGKTLFRCHKLIVASFSIYFEELLAETHGDSILSLDQMAPEHVQHLPYLIDFMYGFPFEASSIQLSRILNAAKAFRISVAVKYFEEKLKSDEDHHFLQGQSFQRVALPGLASVLVVRVQQLWNQIKFFDLRIVYEKTSIWEGHRLVVAAFSPHFDNLLARLNADSRSNILMLTSLDYLYADFLPLILSYAYGNSMTICTDQIDKLMDAAVALDFPILADGQLGRAQRKLSNYLNEKALQERLERIRQGVNTIGSFNKTNGIKNSETCGNDFPAAANVVIDGEIPTVTDVNHRKCKLSTTSKYGDNLVMCDYCNKVFLVPLLRKALERHRRLHCPIFDESSAKLVAIRCSSCRDRFNTLDSLRTHQYSQHARIRDFFSCQKCRLPFRGKGAFELHNAEQHSEMVPDCSIFPSTPLPTSAIQLHRNVEDFSDKSDKLDQSQFCYDGNCGVVTDHEAAAGSSSVCAAVCVRCELALPSRRMLVLHLRTHHDGDVDTDCSSTVGGLDGFSSALEDSSSDGVCGNVHSPVASGSRPLPVVNSSTAHVLAGKDAFLCSTCYKFFKTRKLLDVHIQNLHGAAGLNDDTANNSCRNKVIKDADCIFDKRTVNKYCAKKQSTLNRCTLCESFAGNTRLSLDKHVRIVHGVNLAGDPISEVKCELCDVVFAFECDLSNHLDKVHTDKKKFSCSYCDYRAKEKGSVKKHIRNVHTLERPFSCEYCHKSFNTQSILQRHRRMHTGERPNVCRACGEGYANKRDLDVHILKDHTKKKPFKCHLCDSAFFRKDYLVRHKRKHDGAQKDV